jgi:hypothetical protein
MRSTLANVNRSFRALRLPLVGLVVLLLAIALVLPALAASPAPSAATLAGKPSKEPKADRSPEPTVTVHGLVSATKRADGTTDMTIASGATTLHLHVGPPWFAAASDPLAAFAGKTVTIVGEQDGDTIDVDTVDGVAVRGSGKPPWAGGWKTVGSAHPGWSQAKADRSKLKTDRKQARDAARAACLAAGTCAADGPEGSEAPEASDAPEASEAP